MVLFLSKNGIEMQKKLKGDVSLIFAMRDQGNDEACEAVCREQDEAGGQDQDRAV